jgi:hypothetical protein
MDYALAKRIKDAGWPQPIASEATGSYLAEPGSTASKYHGILQEPRDDTAYAPTTDELITALPRDYDGYALTITADIGRGGFKAGYPTKYVWGEILDTALAELWLTGATHGGN